MYTSITITEMEDFLKVGRGWVKKEPKGQEVHFDKSAYGCVIRVFSSIPSASSMELHDVSRGKGKDAIRISLLYITKENRTVGLRSYPRVTRQQNWRTHLKRRVMEAFVCAKDSPLCPHCKSKLVLRTAEATGAQFYGCTRYPRCRGTRALIDYAADVTRLAENARIEKVVDSKVELPVPDDNVQVGKVVEVSKKSLLRSVVDGVAAFFK